MMFINLSNHPHSGWLPEQVEAAELYGEIVDLPFPQIPSQMTVEELDAEAERYFALVTSMIRGSEHGAEGRGVRFGQRRSSKGCNFQFRRVPVVLSYGGIGDVRCSES